MESWAGPGQTRIISEGRGSATYLPAAPLLVSCPVRGWGLGTRLRPSSRVVSPTEKSRELFANDVIFPAQWQLLEGKSVRGKNGSIGEGWIEKAGS